LRPLKRIPLRAGRVDFAPVAGIILVFLFVHLAENGIKPPPRTGENRQPLPPLINLPGLVDIYRKLPI